MRQTARELREQRRVRPITKIREAIRPAPRPSLRRLKRLPTPAEIEAIPIIAASEFDLSDRETAKLRRMLYAINREARGVRYRTLRDGTLLLVWGIRRFFRWLVRKNSRASISALTTLATVA